MRVNGDYPISWCDRVRRLELADPPSLPVHPALLVLAERDVGTDPPTRLFAQRGRVAAYRVYYTVLARD